jgi:hypothetical protein
MKISVDFIRPAGDESNVYGDIPYTSVAPPTAQCAVGHLAGRLTIMVNSQYNGWRMEDV